MKGLSMRRGVSWCIGDMRLHWLKSSNSQLKSQCRYDRGTGDQWDEEHNNADHNSEFGFVTMEKPHTLRSFAAYADWMKSLHFSEPPPKVGYKTTIVAMLRRVLLACLPNSVPASFKSS